MTNVLRFSPSKLDRIFNEHRLRGFRKEELRVTSPQNEPFLSGETNDKQARAQWFTQQFNRFYPFGTCRVRGLHYRCVAVGDLLKPNGKVYQNTEDDWCWLGLAATNARWLGLVPFDRIVDNRNDDPIIIQRPPIPELCCRTRPSLLNVGFNSEVDIAVDPEIEGFELGDLWGKVLAQGHLPSAVRAFRRRLISASGRVFGDASLRSGEASRRRWKARRSTYSDRQ